MELNIKYAGSPQQAAYPIPLQELYIISTRKGLFNGYETFA